jgi:hypothetical protein
LGLRGHSAVNQTCFALHALGRSDQRRNCVGIAELPYKFITDRVAQGIRIYIPSSPCPPGRQWEQIRPEESGLRSAVLYSVLRNLFLEVVGFAFDIEYRMQHWRRSVSKTNPSSFYENLETLPIDEVCQSDQRGFFKTPPSICVNRTEKTDIGN